MVYTGVNLLAELKLEHILEDVGHFLSNLPILEKTRLEAFHNSHILKMHYFRIYAKATECLSSKFNLIIDCPEKNYNEGRGRHGRYVNSYFDTNTYEHLGVQYFSNLFHFMENIPSINNATMLFYKKNTYVNRHNHEDPELIAHMLLNDIQNEGYFEIECDNYVHRVSKQGDYFSFDGQLPHSAKCVNGEARFVSASIEMSKIPNLNNLK